MCSHRILFIAIIVWIGPYVFSEEITYLSKNSPSLSRLHITTTDDKNQILPCCLSLIDSNGLSLWGLDAVGKPLNYPGEPRIWISGDTILNVTAGTYRYVLSRPYRYRIASGTLTLVAEKTQTLKASLECIVPLPQYGWYGGDAHQHIVHGEKEYAVNLETVARIACSEGGDWSSFNSSWSSVPGETPTLDDLRNTASRLSNPTFQVLIGDEYPKDHLGHMAFLAGPIEDWNQQIGHNDYSPTEGAHEDYTHFEIMKQIMDRGGLSIYTHPVREYGGTSESPGNIARELPFDVLADPERVPTVDWMTDKPNDENAMNLWAIFLNRGYKIGLCAWTDTCYDRRDARPFNRRTFVFLGTKYLTSANLIDAIQCGRTYGTTGPLMRIDMNGLPPGSVFSSDNQSVVLSIEAFAPGTDYMHRQNEPILDRIEIVRNGESFETIQLHNRQLFAHRMSKEIHEKENAWYIVKVFASGEQQVAISSPFYFQKTFFHHDFFQSPKPIHAHVSGTVTDARTGQILSAQIDVIEYSKDGGRTLRTISVKEGLFEEDCPATTRLRVHAKGYLPQTKSLFFDTPEIYRDLIVPLRRSDQLDPTYYAKIKSVLQNIKMDFVLQPES